MMAFTHGTIGVVSYAGAVALSGGQPTAAGLGAAMLGAWLPDIDTPTSKAGLVVYLLAAWMEKRFGHRTITHSAFGLVVFATLCLPLLLFASTRFLFAPLLVGYGSHLLADAATKSGVPLAWPGRARFVFPGNERFRVQTGSRAEMGVLIAFLLLGALIVPVAKQGPRALLHRFTRDVPGALHDVENYSEHWHCEAEIEGYELMTQRLIQGTFPIIGRRGDGALVIDRDGVLWLANGSSGGGALYRIKPRRIRVLKVRPRQDQTVQVEVSNITLGALAKEVLRASGEVSSSPFPPVAGGKGGGLIRITGQADCYPLPGGALVPVDTPRLGVKTVEFTGGQVQLAFAQPRHLVAGGERVALKAGTLTIALAPGAKLRPLSLPTRREVLTLGHMHRHADLLVSPGDLVRRGQTLQRTFAPAGEDAQTQATRRRAVEELRALGVEERALRKTALWPQLAQGFAQRRVALRRLATATPVVPASAPPAERAPFDAVVESVVWEPPTLPTRPGEAAEQRAQVALVQVRHG